MKFCLLNFWWEKVQKRTGIKNVPVDAKKCFKKHLQSIATKSTKLKKPGTIIKLTEGVFTCNVEITKPGLKIEPREKDKPVYLLGNDGPVLKVKLKENQYIVIKKLLLAHSGINIA